MRTFRGLALVFIASALIFGAGCKGKDKDQGTKTKPAPVDAAAMKAPPPTPDAAAPAPTPPETSFLNNMKHCPAAVRGAKTTIAKTKDAVVVEISGEGDEMVSEIRARTTHLKDVQAAPDSKIEHTGKGTGGSSSGACPVVTKDTTLTVAETKTGATATMKPVAPMTIDQLESEAQKRLVELTAKMAESKGDDGSGGGGGTGAGSGRGGGKGGSM